MYDLLEASGVHTEQGRHVNEAIVWQAIRRLSGIVWDSEFPVTLAARSGGQFLPAEAAPAPAADAAAELIRRFIELVVLLPQVRTVLLEGAEIPRVWTIIEAEPFAWAQREPVYLAQLDAIGTHPQANVDFRLLNLLEYGDEDLSEVLPPQCQVLWER